MSTPRLKSGLWVKAQLRLCDLNFLSCVVVQKGDEDAGQILVKINNLSGHCRVLAERYDDGMEKMWAVVNSGDERAVDSYIAQESSFDPDLWVIEIEDPKGLYKPDGQSPQCIF